MPNFEMMIKNHNKRILDDYMKHEQEEEEKRRQKESKPTRGRPKVIGKKDWNCQNSTQCPMNGRCNQQNVIYKAVINIQEETCKYYVGQATDFKLRYRNHQTSFRNRDSDQKCNLKDEVWLLKDRGKLFNLEWEVLRRSSAYKPGNDMCCLCLDEKLTIMDVFDDRQNINKDKMIQKPCLHKKFYKITAMSTTK